MYFIICSFLCLLVILLPWSPSFNFFIIPKYILLFGPRWWLLTLVLFLFVVLRHLSGRQRLILPFLILLSLNYCDFQFLNILKGSIEPPSKQNQIKLVTYNMGGSSDKELKLLIKYIQPEILLLQEVGNVEIDKLVGDSYSTECASNLCIISKYPFKQEKTLDRKLFGGWGKFAAFYKIVTPNGELLLANVHLETPRPVLESLVYLSFNQTLAKKVESNRQFEVNVISLWEKHKKNTLIVGDFNMPSDENLFRQSFYHMNSAIEVGGFGFNYTKHTYWFGVRIDHILFSNDFDLIEVQVIELLGGDHQPIMATLIMKGTAH